MKKIVIIVLVAVAVLVISVQILRPGGGDSRSTQPNGLIRLVGELTPRVDVSADDVAGQGCWDGSGVLTVPSGAICQAQLPQRANRISLCLVDGALDRLRIQGQKYGPQDTDRAKIGCPTGETFSLYDDRSVLRVQCLPLGPPCRVQLL